MRKVSFMNYVIVAIIFLVTILMIFMVRDLYLQSEKENSNQRVEVLSELKEDDLEGYLIENDVVILYVSSALDKEVEPFEKEFSKYIIDNELEKDIVYMNLDEVSSKFIQKIKNMNTNKKDISLQKANIIVIENGTIVDVLYGKSELISLEDVDKFMKKQEVIE